MSSFVKRIKNANKLDVLTFIIWLSLTCVLLFMASSPTRWVLHPDDKESVIFAQVLFQNGQLFYNIPLNMQYDVTSFWQPIHDLTSGQLGDVSIGSKRSPGYFILLAIGAGFGFQGILYVHVIFSSLGLLFLGLTSRKMFNPLGGLISLVVMGTSAPFVLWTQLLLSNTVAVGFFFGGLYLLVKQIKDSCQWSYPITAFFLLMAFWVRYDFIWPVGFLVLYILFRSIRKRDRNFQFFIIGFFVTLTGILVTNYILTQNIIGTLSFDSTETPDQVLFFYLFTDIDILVLSSNIGMYFVNLIPFAICMALVGIMNLRYRKRNPLMGLLFVLAIIFIFVTLYYGKNPDFWGYGRNWLASSYTRYFLVSTSIVALFCGACSEIIPTRDSGSEGSSHQEEGRGFIVAIQKTASIFRKFDIKEKTVVLILIVGLSSHVVLSNHILNAYTFGLQYVTSYTHERRQFDTLLYDIDPEGIFIDTTNDNYYGGMILSVALLHAGELNNQTAYDIVVDLLHNGESVYLIIGGRTTEYLNTTLIEAGFAVTEEPIPSFNTLESPSIYSVENHV